MKLTSDPVGTCVCVFCLDGIPSQGKDVEIRFSAHCRRLKRDYTIRGLTNY